MNWWKWIVCKDAFRWDILPVSDTFPAQDLYNFLWLEVIIEKDLDSLLLQNAENACCQAVTHKHARLVASRRWFWTQPWWLRNYQRMVTKGHTHFVLKLLFSTLALGELDARHSCALLPISRYYRQGYRWVALWRGIIKQAVPYRRTPLWLQGNLIVIDYLWSCVWHPWSCKNVYRSRRNNVLSPIAISSTKS